MMAPGSASRPRALRHAPLPAPHPRSFAGGIDAAHGGETPPGDSAKSDTGGATAPSGTHTGPDGEPTRILIIDDDEHVTRLIARVLRREGIEALTAPDGATGIDRFRERSAEVAAIVLDLSMPGLSGEETLAGLREVSATVPVLLSSGLADEEVQARFEGLGANAFLAKPYTARTLVRAVRELIGA